LGTVIAELLRPQTLKALDENLIFDQNSKVALFSRNFTLQPLCCIALLAESKQWKGSCATYNKSYEARKSLPSAARRTPKTHRL